MKFDRAVPFVLLAVAALSVFSTFTIDRAAGDIRHAVAELKRARNATMSSTWTSSGTTHTVTTEPIENESFTDTIKRHQQRLAEAQQVFPPDA